MTKLPSRVVGGVPVMMMMIMSTKPLLVTQSIGLSSAGMPVNLHVQTLVLKALLILLETATLTMRHHGEQALTVRWNGLVDHITPSWGTH